MVGAMSVMSKIRNKKLFYLGRHGELPEVSFYQAARVDIDYNGQDPDAARRGALLARAAGLPRVA